MRLHILFILLLLGLCLHCSNDKAANGNAVLSLTFGTYYNFTNYELRQLNFRVSDKELLIDTTYNLKSSDFRTHYIERTADYPEIAKFLMKSSKELKDLQNKLNKLNQVDCGKLNTFWIQLQKSKEIELVKYEWTIKCNPNDLGQVNLVFAEMKKLKNKYKN